MSTQAGNVIACAAGNYVLDVISADDFLKKVNETGAYFADGIRELEKKHKIIGHVEHKGLYIGIELVNDRKTKEPASKAATYVRDRCVEEGVLYEHGGYYQQQDAADTDACHRKRGDRPGDSSFRQGVQRGRAKIQHRLKGCGRI